MKFLLNLNQSIDAIKANLFRAGITIFIIALGITALVFVRTSIDGIKSGLGASFSSLGSNTFRIMNRTSVIQFGRRGRNARQKFPKITLREAQEFKDEFGDKYPVSLTGSGGSTNKVRFSKNETNPNVAMIGTDENYLSVSKYAVSDGRMLSPDDLALARNVVVLGHEVREKLFLTENPIGKTVSISGKLYKVIGTLEEVGATGSSSVDRQVFIPITTLRNIKPDLGSLVINVYVEDARLLSGVMAEAEAVFRVMRKLLPRDNNNFAASKSDAFIGQLLQQIQIITIAAQIIAVITLLGAAVALLNVMLVSVTERTREIGLRKSLGASRNNILSQFLWEAIVICQIGGILGILLGIVGGNLVSTFLFKGGFVVPWDWIFRGFMVCLTVGVISGLYPARKAAKVDPIVALRHV
ncbi:MAG: ABC transporter permease [Bacteroidia bacterium]|nr:ABC transporter permease [Bacteroidia bacterium]